MYIMYALEAREVMPNRQSSTIDRDVDLPTYHRNGKMTATGRPVNTIL